MFGYKPDLIVHRPGDMTGNHAVIEVKSAIGAYRGYGKDLGTLALFRRAVSYKRAIYLVYGREIDEELVERIASNAAALAGLLLSQGRGPHEAPLPLQSKTHDVCRPSGRALPRQISPLFAATMTRRVVDESLVSEKRLGAEMWQPLRPGATCRFHESGDSETVLGNFALLHRTRSENMADYLKHPAFYAVCIVGGVLFVVFSRGVIGTSFVAFGLNGLRVEQQIAKGALEFEREKILRELDEIAKEKDHLRQKEMLEALKKRRDLTAPADPNEGY
ncbi:MAG: hypothetical protein K2Y27_10260 [Xanthobacteraceae bacterium]|nr:hypothetical protein [Xanthobacteraceae bacterium]